MSCGNFEKAGKALIKKFCRGGQRDFTESAWRFVWSVIITPGCSPLSVALFFSVAAAGAWIRRANSAPTGKSVRLGEKPSLFHKEPKSHDFGSAQDRP